MRVLRASMYPPNGGDPVTTVAPEASLRMSIEEAAQAIKVGDIFVTTDVFEVDGDDVTDAFVLRVSIEAEQRRQVRDRRERDMAVAYYYWTAMFQLTSASGIIASPRPAPLSTAEIEEVFALVRRHSDYKAQSIVVVAEDGTVCRLAPSVSPL